MSRTHCLAMSASCVLLAYALSISFMLVLSSASSTPSRPDLVTARAACTLAVMWELLPLPLLPLLLLLLVVGWQRLTTTLRIDNKEDLGEPQDAKLLVSV